MPLPLVEEGHRVSLTFDGHYFISDPLTQGKTLKLSRTENPLIDNLIGLPYGSHVLVSNKQFQAVDPPGLPPWPLILGEGDQKTNQNINDDQTAQSLQQDDIAAIKNGENKDSLVSVLCENSKTFQERTVFAQQKYIARKKRKHNKSYYLQEVTPRVVCFTFLKKSPDRICFLTPDALSYVIQLAGTGPAPSPALVFDSTDGLLYSAVYRRSPGRPIHVVHTSFSCRHHLATLSGCPEPTNSHSIESASTLPSLRCRSLVMVATSQELPLTLAVWHHLVSGAPFAIWNISVDPLLKLRILFKTHNIALMLCIRELSVTPMNVAPGISRPVMNYAPGNGSGDGFVLCGWKCAEIPNDILTKISNVMKEVDDEVKTEEVEVKQDDSTEVKIGEPSPKRSRDDDDE
ncbi:hypothetical protein GEMRC1_002943 [Eukaryota sp. GEM-RC1]